MKKNIFVSAIAAIVLFIGCSPEGSVRSVDYQTFAEEIAVDDIVLVDVRTAEEYAAGHIPGAVNIDSSAENFEEQICEFSNKKPIAMYCRGGRRSKEAAARIISLGYDVIDLDKGFNSWEGDVVVEQTAVDSLPNKVEMTVEQDVEEIAQE